MVSAVRFGQAVRLRRAKTPRPPRPEISSQAAAGSGTGTGVTAWKLSEVMLSNSRSPDDVENIIGRKEGEPDVGDKLVARS